MKLKVLLIGVTAALLSVSVAVAAPPPGKGKPASPGKSAAAGKPATTGPGCRPMVTVVLKGAITGTTPITLTMTVARANRWGRAYLTAGSATVNTTPDTKVRRNGGKLLADLKATDWVLLQARACKADLLVQGTPPTLTAVRVVAHPAKA